MSSGAYTGSKFDPDTIIEGLKGLSTIKLVGLGIGPDTKHVEDYYPNAVANVELEQMVVKLSELSADMIENSNSY